MTYRNGASTTYVYWASGALSKIAHYNDGNSVIASVAYAYDKAGNVTKATLDDALYYDGDATITYKYDEVGRLTHEDCDPPSGNREDYDYKYWYDAAGNRTKMWYDDGADYYETTYEYSPRNELTKMTEPGDGDNITWTYEYDYRGNLTKRDDGGYEYAYWDYHWSSDNRLTKVYYYNDTTEDEWTVEYLYDAMGRRVAKRVDEGDWRWYFYDGLKVLAEGTGTNDKVFYTLAPGAIGGIIARDENGTKYWYHYDRLGNVMAVTDSDGDLYAGYTMEAFGNVLEVGTSSGYYASQSDPQPYHLTTKEYDEDAGLYYFNARWYDAKSGRFVSRDPDRIGSQAWPYQYVHNSPMNAIDPDGRVIEVVGGGQYDWREIGESLVHVCTKYKEIDWMAEFPPYGNGQFMVFPGCDLKKCFEDYCEGKKDLTIFVGGDRCKPRRRFPAFWKKFEPMGYTTWWNKEAGIVVCPKFTARNYSAETIAHEIAHLCGFIGESTPKAVGKLLGW